ncbi:MAG: sulfatase [Myxococcota bacterium]
MRYLPPVLSLVLPLVLAACSGPDVEDDPLPTDTNLEPVGGPALKFRGRVPKNLLFLSIDTFRKDHLTAYGGDDLTPFIDRIASEGMTLDDHMQCSNWTFASTTCTLAGRYNIERGHIPRLNGNDANRPPVPPGTKFLASWLHDAGFYSVIVSGNDWLSSNWGNTQGYDEALKPNGSAPQVWSTGQKAIRQAIDGGADRWFLHLHFMEPHASYDPPMSNVTGEDLLEPWPEDLTDRDTHYKWRDEWPNLADEDRDLLAAHLRNLYDGEIRTIDERLADIWDDLDREGYLDDTLVVLWNDHGEQFWEHNHQTHAFAMHGEENDAFAIFWARNIIPGHYTAPTSSIDLVPTVLDTFGIERPPEVTGFVVGTAPADRPRFGESLARLGGINMIEHDGLKMQFYWTGAVTVFDRKVDPLETTNVFDPADPEQLKLWAQLKPMAMQMSALIVGGSPTPNYPSTLP